MPNEPTMRDEIAEVVRYRYLLQMLVRRELKVRYKNSALGFLWSIVPPLLQVFVYTFVISGVLGARVPHYSAYLLCGIIPWTFFSTALLDSSQSLIDNYGLIKKFYLPREAIPLACVISNLIHFLLGWVVYFIAFMLVARLKKDGGIPLLPSLIWFPVLTMMEVLLVTGLSLWVSALNVFYDDVKFVIQTLFGLLFFLMPIIYPSDVVRVMRVMRLHPWLFKLYMLNPVAAIIDAYRKIILEPISPSHFNHIYAQDNSLVPSAPIDWFNLFITFLLCLLAAYTGYRYFNSRKWQFVERP